MNLLRKLDNIRIYISSYFVVKERKRNNPLFYSKILKESDESFSHTFFYHPIDTAMYIEAYVTSSGVQSCGLYFKVLRASFREEHSSGNIVYDLCRISMNEPKYIEGYDETFRLNKKQRERLMEMLKKPFSKETGETVWDHIIWVLKDAQYYYPKAFPNSFDDLKIPDYTKLPD